MRSLYLGPWRYIPPPPPPVNPGCLIVTCNFHHGGTINDIATDAPFTEHVKTHQGSHSCLLWSATVEMALSTMGDRRGMWEELFVKKWGFRMDGPVGLVKAIAAYMMFAGAVLEVGASPLSVLRYRRWPHRRK